MSKSIIMGKVYWIIRIIFAAIVLLLATGCGKEEITRDIEWKPTHWPIVEASKVTNRTNSTATLNGIVNAYGLSTKVTFEYGTTASYGSIATAYQSPATGDSITNVSANISGLIPNIIYHYRVRAENSLWTNFYGKDMEFTIPTDADGNAYNTVNIGRQIWLVENLKTTKYLNGDPLMSNLRGSEWTNTASGAYQISSDIYGNLYNAYAVADERQICPAGWHVPSASEWNELLIYLGGEENAGGRMKEAGTSHWLEPNFGATNESGFTALPEGFVSIYGDTISIGSNTAWWSSSKENEWYWTVQCSFASKDAVRTQWNIEDGLSVRCVKDSLNPAFSAPFVSTGSITDITGTTAKCGGNITSDCGATITSCGVCWSIKARPTTADSKSVDGAGIGQYVSNITGLTAGTTYHVRAYATNSAGTRYGEDMTFSTWGEPIVTSRPATNISKTGATLNGTVNANGLPTTVTFEYQYDDGRGWKEVSQTVTAIQSPLTGNTETEVSASLTGLADGTYTYRVKAENSLGTVLYPVQESFDIGGQAPAAATLTATNLASGTATLNSTVNAGSILTGVDFEYGTTTSYGQESSASHITGNTSTNVSICITGLTNGVTYHYRVRAANSIAIAYGDDMEFTLYAPTAETLEATDLTSNTATLNGIINANSFPSNVTFEYGTDTSYGQEITPEQSPVTGTAGTNVSATLSGLTCGIKYYFRVKAENSFGISYGDYKTINSANIPVLTASVSGITATTAILEGNIADDECAAVTMRGFFWTPYAGALLPSNHSGRGFYGTLNGSGTGSYTHYLTGLNPSTVYFFQPYARNSNGNTRGKIISFKTLSSGK
jgi:uncharacterized protein (TIGR02145 family)